MNAEVNMVVNEIELAKMLRKWHRSIKDFNKNNNTNTIQKPNIQRFILTIYNNIIVFFIFY